MKSNAQNLFISNKRYTDWKFVEELAIVEERKMEMLQSKAFVSKRERE